MRNLLLSWALATVVHTGAFAGDPVTLKVGESRSIRGSNVSCVADISVLVDGPSAGFKDINYQGKPIFAATSEEVIALIDARQFPLDDAILDFAKVRAKALCKALGYTDRVSFGLNWEYAVTAVSLEIKDGRIGDVIEKNDFAVSVSRDYFSGTAAPHAFKDLRCGIAAP